VSTANFYESERAVAEYLLFHYGLPNDVLPYDPGPATSLNFPVRCVTECADVSRLPAAARALDLGCAVGRATFELARHCAEVIGIDSSDRFISVAEHLQTNGAMHFTRLDEGELTTMMRACVPHDVQRDRVRFERGDAMELREDLGTFDVVLMANLIDRLTDPRRCLERLSRLVRRGGRLVITSPYTWLTCHTPRENWLGGFLRDGRPIRTLDTLKQILSPDFGFARSKDMPFLIREHARKFQWSVAEASIWLRH
jgi:putative 4-mercaptohistidine N1-methyltranferase